MIDSDHRGLWADIRLADLLKGPAATIDPPKGRAFLSTNPKSCIEFRERVFKYLEDHQVFERCDTLRQDSKAQTIPKEHLIQRLEALDADMTRAMESAEKAVRRAKHTLPYSPHLMNARGVLHYWKMWQSEALTNVWT